MGIEKQVYLKSDRQGRGLILVFCLAPLIVPLLTIGGKFALDDPQVLVWARMLSSSAQASAPNPIPLKLQLGRLPTRDEFHSSLIFAAPSESAQDFQWTTGSTRLEQSLPGSDGSQAELALRRDH